jgi:hypothetical protein
MQKHERFTFPALQINVTQITSESDLLSVKTCLRFLLKDITMVLILSDWEKKILKR